jgi:hypothetical protein
MGGMIAQAPPTWLEDLATAHTSWIFDATGLIWVALIGAHPKKERNYAGQALCGTTRLQRTPAFGPAGWQTTATRVCGPVSCAGWHSPAALTQVVGSAWASPTRLTPPTAPMIAISAAPKMSTRCVNFLIIPPHWGCSEPSARRTLEIRENWLVRAFCQYVLDFRQDQCFDNVSWSLRFRTFAAAARSAGRHNDARAVSRSKFELSGPTPAAWSW